jgi:hypothetical protein
MALNSGYRINRNFGHFIPLSLHYSADSSAGFRFARA